MPAPVTEPSAPPRAAAPPAAAAGLSGRLELRGGGGQTVAAGEVADGLVYFLPKGGSPRPKPGRFSIDTRSKGFSPSMLVVPVGSTVRFPNRDTILHSVFSQTPGAAFDLGVYSPGEVRQTVMSKAGLVIVSCNVHHGMRANVVVLETPYYVRPDRAGRFTLAGLPAGPGTLVFFHPRSSAQTMAVTLPLAAPVARMLVASKPRIDASMTMEH